MQFSLYFLFAIIVCTIFPDIYFTFNKQMLFQNLVNLFTL